MAEWLQQLQDSPLVAVDAGSVNNSGTLLAATDLSAIFREIVFSLSGARLLSENTM